MKKKINSILKNKRLVIFLVLLLIFIICLIVIKSVFIPSGGSKYGNRLDGINNIKFTKNDQVEIIKLLNDKEKVSTSKINIHGKIINVIFDVSDDVSIDEAKNIANESLGKFSDEVKNFYDIEFIIKKTTEKGIEKNVTSDDGKTSKIIVKEFPIMGYKKAKRETIVW